VHETNETGGWCRKACKAVRYSCVAKLIICEKPSVAGDVATALGSLERFSKTSWGYQSQNWWVCAAAGHLVEMSQPEAYDAKYKTWKYDDLPIIPDRYAYQPRDARGGERLKEISGLINSAEITSIVNACDAGREGELIFALIYQYSRSSKPVERAWFNSMTSAAIVEAFGVLRPSSTYAGLEAAARCRSEADWLVGMNATRAASTTLGGDKFLLSIGRVQTPTLALIVERDLSIENFVATPYYQVSADFVLESPNRLFTGWWRSGREGEIVDRMEDKETAEKVALRVKTAAAGEIESVEVKNENIQPPRLFDLTSLQREANKRHGMSAARTLAAAQSLYESHKYLTYPRTDSQYITSDMKSAVAGLVQVAKNSMPELAPAVAAVESDLRAERLVNDAKVTDHHAIILTDGIHDLGKLSEDEKRIYELVARRFLAALLPPQVLERTVAWVRVDTPEKVEWFRAAGRREIEAGWRLAWPEQSGKQAGKQKEKDAEGEEDGGGEEDGTLCELAKGETPNIKTTKLHEKMTKPPARFNEASLLGAMETAGRLVDDEAMAEAMKERGLGTPATRAAILENLIDRSYIEREGRALVATDKGRGLIVALRNHPLVRPDLTGEWEQRLRQIEKLNKETASQGRVDFTKAVKDFVREVVASFAGKTTADLQAGRRSFGACPQPGCGGAVVLGKIAWGCTSWKSKEEPGCGFVYWREQSGKKQTEKHLLEYMEKVRSGEIVVGARAVRVVLGPCPRCGADVVERSKGWGCSSWKSKKEAGCGYAIWKTNQDGTVVDAETAGQMLQDGRTNQAEKVVVCECPRCGGNIVERPKFYGCDSWKSPRQKGCGILAWKMNKGVALSLEEILAEIQRQAAEEPAKPVKRKSKPKSK
jgi:DNA topoisomerase-3